MDQVTQQNAAMVEEATAASQSLLRETEQLSNLVEQFKIGLGTDDDAMPGKLRTFVSKALLAAVRRRI